MIYACGKNATGQRIGLFDQAARVNDFAVIPLDASQMDQLACSEYHSVLVQSIMVLSDIAPIRLLSSSYSYFYDISII
jgi:hypothetical protein